MAQNKQSYSDPIGPMLWVRFLLHRLECDLERLSAQLPQPIEATETKFELGVSPPPDPSIPDMFRRTYDLGKNPDGAYFNEPDGSGSKFNLFMRVVARIPESEPWLLTDAAPYFNGEQSVDQSAKIATALLAKRSKTLLSAEAVHAWCEHDSEGIVSAECLSLDALAAEGTPEALTLLLSLLHLAVWHFTPVGRSDITNPDLIDTLTDCCTQSATSLGQLEWLQRSEQGRNLAFRLYGVVSGATRWLRIYGHRSNSFDQMQRRFPTKIALVHDTTENQQLMRALSLRSSLYWFEPMIDQNDYQALPQDWGAVKRALQLAVQSAALSA